MMEGGKDLETEKYAEFASSTLLSLKSKAMSIMAELGPENKLGRKTVGFSSALPFSLQTLSSPGGSVQEGDQAVATEIAAGRVGSGRIQ